MGAPYIYYISHVRVKFKISQWACYILRMDNYRIMKKYWKEKFMEEDLWEDY
jgi:hypothetical protein